MIHYKSLEASMVVTARLKNYDIAAEFIKMVEGSRTMAIVKDIDRGKGWSDRERKYVGVKTGYGWYKGENYGYGDEHIVHVNNLFEFGTAPEREAIKEEKMAQEQPAVEESNLMLTQ